MRRRMMLIAASALFAFAAPALAHAMLERAEPAAGAMLLAAPTQISLRFSERIEPALSRIELTTSSGAAIALGPIERAPDNPRVLSTHIRAPLAAGSYHVRWSVTSADGHATQGSYDFMLN